MNNTNPYMTPEEIKETLYRTLDRLDAIYWEGVAAKELLHKEREAHALEVKNLKAEMERKLTEKDSIIAEKDRAIAEKDRAIAEKDRAIVEKDNRLAEKDNHITALEQELAESEVATINLLEDPI